jgi:HlyD family type I secretion membrane fusion protein
MTNPAPSQQLSGGGEKTAGQVNIGSISAATDTQSPPPAEPTMGIKAPITIGFIIVFLFFGVFMGWAAFAPLGSAAIAPGVVSVESNRKTIQHLEGGIVSEIRVKDGDQVTSGQVLILLDSTQPQASLGLVRGRRVAALAREARLISERDGKKSIKFPDVLLSRSTETNVSDAMTGQQNIFAARRKSQSGQVAILGQRVSQFNEEIRGLKGLIKAEERQITLIADEIEDVSKLVKKGLAQRPRLRALQRNSAEIEGNRSQNRAKIAQARQAIAEAKLQISEITTEHLNEVVQELREVQSELFELEERERASADILKRTDVRAQIDGTVVNLQVHTAGGVIAPGAPILDIVPANERLIVEAQVDPGDIDVVHVGLAAQIRFPAFSQRNTLPVEARVLQVSADSLTDERTGSSYYLTRVAIEDDLEIKLQGAPLYPGMQAEVIILTGERTALDYFLKPILASVNRAFRED